MPVVRPKPASVPLPASLIGMGRKDGVKDSATTVTRLVPVQCWEVVLEVVIGRFSALVSLLMCHWDLNDRPWLASQHTQMRQTTLLAAARVFGVFMCDWFHLMPSLFFSPVFVAVGAFVPSADEADSHLQQTGITAAWRKTLPPVPAHHSGRFWVRFH